MKTKYALALMLLISGAVVAQDATQKAAIKTTKMAQQNAKQLQKQAKQSGNKTQKADADKTLNAAKRAEKQAKKNTQ